MTNIPSEALRGQLLALFPVYWITFMAGCSGGWITNAIYFFQNGNEVSATILQCALIASFSEIGRALFAIPGGMLVDKFGRKAIIICAGILHFLSWLTLSLNSSIIAICIVRFALGATTALSDACAFVTIGEIAPSEVRGTLVAVARTFYSFGMISQSIITLLFLSYSILSYITTAFSLLFFISLYWILETPNYLISVSKIDQAKVNLKRLRLGYSEDYFETEFKKLQEYVEEEKFYKKETNWWQFLTSKAIRKPITTLTLLTFFLTLNGKSYITTYITLVLPSNDFVPVQYYSLISHLIQLILSICTSFYVDKYPRRSIYMIGASLMIVTMAFCAYSNFWWMEYDNRAAKWLFLLSNVVVIVIHDSSMQPINQASRSEILPQAIKGIGVSLSIIAQAAASTISCQLYQCINNNFSSYYLYVIFSVDALILCILVYFCLPESRGKFLADVQKDFKNKQSSRQNSKN